MHSTLRNNRYGMGSNRPNRPTTSWASKIGFIVIEVQLHAYILLQQLEGWRFCWLASPGIWTARDGRENEVYEFILRACENLKDPSSIDRDTPANCLLEIPVPMAGVNMPPDACICS